MKALGLGGREPVHDPWPEMNKQAEKRFGHTSTTAPRRSSVRTFQPFRFENYGDVRVHCTGTSVVHDTKPDVHDGNTYLVDRYC